MESWDMVVLPNRTALCLFQASPLQSRSLLALSTHAQFSQMGQQCAGAQESMDGWAMVVLLNRTPQFLFQA
jgi:hypothetical protein